MSTTPGMGNPRQTQAYRKAARKVALTATICHLCGGPLDHTLPRSHPEAATADHITPLARGGHILGPMQAAHRRCNASKGAGPRTTKTPMKPTTSRHW